MKLEELIESHRPAPGKENEPCGTGKLHHLNQHGLMAKAVRAQMRAEGRDVFELVDVERLTITNQVAWEVLSDAMRHGLRLTPKRPRIHVAPEVEEKLRHPSWLRLPAWLAR